MFGKIVKPCAMCPFRCSPKFPGLRRADEIADAVLNATFACHETTGVKGNKPKDGKQFCAGALTVLRNEGRLYHNQMVRIADRLSGFNESDYDHDIECYDSLEEWVEAMEEA